MMNRAEFQLSRSFWDFPCSCLYPPCQPQWQGHPWHSVKVCWMEALVWAPHSTKHHVPWTLISQHCLHLSLLNFSTSTTVFCYFPPLPLRETNAGFPNSRLSFLNTADFLKHGLAEFKHLPFACRMKPNLFRTQEASPREVTSMSQPCEHNSDRGHHGPRSTDQREQKRRSTVWGRTARNKQEARGRALYIYFTFLKK